MHSELDALKAAFAEMGVSAADPMWADHGNYHLIRDLLDMPAVKAAAARRRLALSENTDAI